MPDGVFTPAAGVGQAVIVPGVIGIPRALYLYENKGVQVQTVDARALYLYENRAVQDHPLLARALYLYENRMIQALAVLARAEYIYEATVDGEVFPWLMRLNPNEQVRGGQVALYGDGFGEVLEIAADVANVVTASSTSGGNVPGFAVNRAATEWVSTSGAAAWLRITFPSSRVVVGFGLEDLAAGGWGVPLFRFSDGGADANGGVAPLSGVTYAEYPVGARRTYYALAAPRTVTWVEVRIASGGSGTNRGLREVWVYTDTDAAAEGSEVLNNLGLPDEAGFGIVSWQNRSPGLYPANSGLPIDPAAVVTVPSDAESGMLVVRESI